MMITRWTCPGTVVKESLQGIRRDPPCFSKKWQRENLHSTRQDEIRAGKSFQIIITQAIFLKKASCSLGLTLNMQCGGGLS